MIRSQRYAVLMFLLFVGLCCGSSVEAQNNEFTLTGNMISARYAQTSTLLNNGLVLVAGGCSSGGTCLNSSELYNPANGTFTVSGIMTSKRWGHTATLLNDGTVLVTGGCTGGGSCLATADIYNPTTNTFAATGAMHAERYSHLATLLDSGKVLITGGCSSSGNCLMSAEIYDPILKIFTTTGSMTAKRYDQAGALLPNGKVLITGGCTGGGSCLATAELYDPIAGTFSTTGSMSTPRYTHTATELSGGSVLIAGGCTGNGSCLKTAEIYSPSLGTFSLTGPMVDVRYAQVAALLADGTVLMAGGCSSGGNCTATAETYSQTTGTFTATGSMSTQRYSYAATLLPDNKVLVTGGCTGGGSCTKTAELYTGQPFSTGFISPKFIIVGITYAPPGGTGSSVQYSDSTFVGTTTSLNTSFTNQNAISVSIGASIAGWGSAGSITGTASNAFTQGSSNSLSVTASKTTTELFKETGTPNPFSPVNHDYDVIWLWLNPVVVLNFTAASQNHYQWVGYGYDTTDQPTMDLYPVAVGELNGDFQMSPSTMKELARGWCTTETWPAGQGPALTSADYKTILASDPFASSSYVFTLANGVSPATTVDGRFTLASNTTSFPYAQCFPGNTCVSDGYTSQYTQTTALGTGTTFTYQQVFGLEEVFGETPMNGGFKVDLKQTQTLTWTSQWQSTITNTNTETGQFTIVPPSCTGDPCNPAYSGPPNFDVYQDNIYGTFTFVPAN